MTIPTSGVFALLAPHKADILASALQQAQASGAQPTVEMVKSAGLVVARAMAVELLRPQCKAKLDVAVTMHGFTGGPRPTSPIDDPTYVKWREDFDQCIMDTLGEDICKAAGQDWLGEHATDSEIDEMAVREAAAHAMARNIVQANILERQPGQVLAEIGIVAEDLAGVAPQSATAATSTASAVLSISESTARGHVERLVGTKAIADMAAGAYNPDKLVELLKGAFDDDPFLPLGFIEQLGGTQADQPYFAAYFKAAGKEAIANTAQAAMMAGLTGQIVEMPKDAPKPKKGKKTATEAPPPIVAAPPVAPPAPPRAPGDDDITDVIKLMLLHGGDSQEEVGKLVGKSRAHINNVKAGKAKVTVTETQRTSLISRLQDHITGLQQAVARLG